MATCIGALALSACGGGGSGPRPAPTPIAPPAPPPPPPPPPAPPPPPPPAPTSGGSFDDAEYRRSNGSTSSGVLAAWNIGARGQGVTVAVVDTGINPNLSEFSGRIHPASQDVAGNRGLVDREGHGTAVAGVIAMNRDGSGAVGIAFDSRIMSLNSASPDSCDDDGCSHTDRNIARAVDIARTNGAKVINVSLGGEAVSDSVLAAVSRAASAGIVVVISAGNDSLANPSGFALANARQGSGHVIIAGAMDSTRSIADFSNRAGSGSAYYLVALGSRVRTVDEQGVATAWSGTSFSAPVISGAAALLASAFPNLTGRQIVELLLTSADDAGAAGRDSEFGNGILNIARAVAPRGPLAVAGTGTPVDQAGAGEASEAMGDATPTMTGVIVLDGYSRAYSVDLAQRVARAPAQRPLERGLQADLSTADAAAGGTMVSVTVRRSVTGRPQVGMAQTGVSYEDSRAARAVAGHAVSRLSPRTAVALGFSESGRTLQQRLAEQEGAPFLVARDPMSRSGFAADSDAAIGMRHEIGGTALTFVGESGRVEPRWLEPGRRDDGYNLAGLSVEQRFGRAELTLGLSRLDEARTVLGGRFDFAPGGSTSWFVDAVAAYDLGGGWGASASYRRGWTAMPGGALATRGSLESDAWAIDLTRRGALTDGDRFALRLMQSLRVRSGGYAMSVPVSYDYAVLGVGYEARQFSLAPSGREIDVEAAYSVPLFGGAGWLGANAFVRSEPGHFEAMRPDIGAAARFSLSF